MKSQNASFVKKKKDNYTSGSAMLLAVEKTYRIFQMRLWVPLLRMNETWKQNGVTDEEDWGVVAHQVPIAFFSVKLDRKSTRVSSRVRRARLTANCAKPDRYRGLLTHLSKDRGLAVF